VYKCKKCGSTELEQQNWVNMNTGKIVSIVEFQKDSAWCPGCEVQIHIDDIIEEEEEIDETK